MTALTGIDCVRERVPLAERTWFKLGGPAQFFAEPASVDELLEIVKRCRDEGLHVRLLGGGSNVLVREEGVSGTVIALSHRSFSDIHIDGTSRDGWRRRKLANAVSVTVGAGLSGLEPLVGIPGTVGGALHGNAGSHGGDIGQWACRAIGADPRRRDRAARARRPRVCLPSEQPR